MPVQVGIVVLAVAGDHHDLPSPQLSQDILNRQAGPAGAQHQALPAQNPHPALPDHALKPGRVGVVPQQRPVQLLDHGVHTADGRGGLGEIVADGQHGGLIRDGHVQALKIPGPDKIAQLVRGDLKELIVIVPKKGMQFRGIAMPQLLSQQSASH